MSVYELNPLEDPRWPRLIQRHPEASIFHSVGWLEALRRTYGYKPVAYTTTPPGHELTDGIVFCGIKSWLSGCRLVSLPFSDHCQPLVDGPENATQLLNRLKQTQDRERWKYIELRLLSADSPFAADRGICGGESYSLQVVDLRPDIDTLFRRFHKSCVQRKIQRAEREHLTYEEGRSEALLRKFYSLLILTRRRHGIPPQPLAWFRNIIASLEDRIIIRVASKGDRPIASIVTITHKDAMVYKYGCSDTRFNNLGGTALIFWKAIQDAKRNGAVKFDFGRSELTNHGLIGFKENWGAVSLPLNYLRLSTESARRPHSLWTARMARNLFSKMPNSLLTVTGKLLYRHIG